MGKIHPRMTPSRKEWLETLENGPAKRGRSMVGFQCMQLGWTEWDIKLADGSRLERITEAGRSALKQEGET